MILRILGSLVLPITVAGLVPAVLGWGHAVEPIAWRLALGGALAMVGLGLLGWTIALFGRVGKGTLAPWDPPKHLVVVGPYRHVRNPMISGVVALVGGEALLTGSLAIGGWAVFVWALNHAWFQVYEEPGLRERFGAEFDAYCRQVPRWIPRIRPWSPS